MRDTITTTAAANDQHSVAWGSIAVISALLINGLCSFMLISFYPQAIFSGDSQSYLEPASTLWHSFEFKDATGAEEVFRTPLYPLFLSLSYGLNLKFEMYFFLSHFLLTCIVLIYVQRIGLLIGTKKLSQIAAILLLLNPNFLLFQNKILAEHLLTAALLMCVYYHVAGYKNNKPSFIFISFILATFCTFTKPVMILFPLILFSFAFVKMFSIDLKKKYRYLAAAALGVAVHVIAVSAWSNYNLERAGTSEFATVSSYNMNSYLAASIIASGTGRDWADLQQKFSVEYFSLPTSERSKFAFETLVQAVTTHPTSAAIIFTKGLATNMLEPGWGEWLSNFGLRQKGSGIIYQYQSLSTTEFIKYLWSQETLLLLSTGAGLMCVILIWLAFFYGLSRHPLTLPTLLMAATIFYMLAVSAGPQALSRFRMPVLPLILLISSQGLLQMGDFLRKRGTCSNFRIRQS